MKRVLVIGAGYLGGEVLGRFREGGWEARGASLSGGYGLLACDVGVAGSVNELPDADAVVHCASSGRGGEEAYRNVYLDGCRNLTGRFPEARILFTSSTSVYSQMDGEMVDETSEDSPDRGTGKILLEAEQAVTEAGGVVARGWRGSTGRAGACCCGNFWMARR